MARHIDGTRTGHADFRHSMLLRHDDDLVFQLQNSILFLCVMAWDHCVAQFVG
jgi:hypothetical protein